MTKNVRKVGQEITSGAEDLFSGKAKWVQTWISYRGLPFLALIALTLGYYQVSSGISELPASTQVWLSYILFAIVVIRLLPDIRKISWSMVFGGYQVSLAFVAGLLLFGNADEDPGLNYWVYLTFWCWLMGLLYSKKYLMPGEFGTISVLTTAVIGTGAPPLDAWIFITLVFVPVILWLQWKHNLTKPVLVLSALVVIVWLSADIKGPSVIFALAATLGLLWFVVFAISRLAKNDMSSFVYGLGIGVISGLIFFVVVPLADLSTEYSATWWLMTGLYAGVAWFLYRKNGGSLFPILFLWGIHWSVISSAYTWLEIFNGIEDSEIYTYGFPLAMLLGAFALRQMAVSMDKKRLYTWAQLYMAGNALIAGFLYSEYDATITRFIFTFTVFAFALWFAKPLSLGKSLPWWKGMINPRHIVAVRRIARKSGNYVVSIPFIGPTVIVIIQGIKVLSHLKKGNEKVNTGDLLLILWSICMALFCTMYVDVFVIEERFIKSIMTNSYQLGVMEQDETLAEWLILASNTMSSLITLFLAAIFFALIGTVYRQPLYEFLTMAAFSTGPVSLVTGEFSGTALFWLSCIVAAGGVLSVRILDGDGAEKSM